MEQTLPEVGVREAKNNFSALTAKVNSTGLPITVLRNNKPWVVIYPAVGMDNRRRKRREKLDALTASIENDTANEPVWDTELSDKDLLGQERMKRFG